MRRTLLPVRQARLALVLGLLLLAGSRESGAQPMSFYYWRDAIGLCPAACDSSRYGCPCRKDYCHVVDGDLKCGF